MSKIATDTTAALMALFAGQTVTHSAIGKQIDLEYANARRKTTFGSYVQVFNALTAQGVTCQIDNTPLMEHLYTFPAA